MRRCIALIVLLFAAAANAETPWPLKTPAELKALRGSTSGGMQILTYRRVQDPAAAGTAADITVAIGRDIMFREEGGNRRVVDLRLRRIYDLQNNKRYINSPMAADLVWRDTELLNRTKLGKAVSAAASDQDKQSLVREPFWDATELKVTTANEAAPAVETRQDRGETVFVYNGVEAIRWRPMDKPLPATVAANLGRALLWFFPGHPDLHAKLAASGRAPQRFVVRWRGGGQLRTDEYELTGARWCETCEALPADAQPGLWAGGFFETDLAPIMVAATQGKFQAVSSEEYLRRVEAALDRGAYVEAFLWFLERALQDATRKCQPDDAGDYCRVQNRLFTQVQGSADIQAFRRNLATQSVPAANAIAALRKQAGAAAHYNDLATVNAMPPGAFWFKSGDQEPLRTAERRMASALDGMPVVPAVYRDIGNLYFAAVDTRKAWLTWEMGKAVPGRSIETNLWQQADRMESQARQRHPEFF